MKKIAEVFHSFRGYLITLVIFAVFLAGVWQGVNMMERRVASEGASSLRHAIARASVQCYAIEGRYPPSVEYLEENYGIRIDRDKYSVFYEGFASNIMPEITVISQAEIQEVES